MNEHALLADITFTENGHIDIAQLHALYILNATHFRNLLDVESDGRKRWWNCTTVSQSLRVVFCYLYFDHQGRLDRDKVKDAALMMEGIGSTVAAKSGSVINASGSYRTS